MSDRKGDIEKYRKGQLSASEMHALEKRALSDPFLAEALEGVESISPEDLSNDLSEINQKILSPKKKIVWLTPLRIAAGILLLIGSGFLIYNLSKPEEQLALQKEETPAPGVSTYDSTYKKEEPELLSLNQPKEATKTELKSESGPKTKDGSGEEKPTAGISSTQTAPAVVDATTKADLDVEGELSEITAEEKIAAGEKIVATEPAQQDLKKEAVSKSSVSRADARKSKLADDVLTRRTVSGQVTSAEDGLPLPGVNVTVKGLTTGTVTDIQGNYSIPLEGDEQKLVFSFIGLKTSEVNVNDQTTLNVKLAEDVSQLSEVVVTGYKAIRDENETPVIKLAEPVGGRKAYDKYLENNLQYPVQALENKVKGKVIIEFTVSTDGALRDFTIMKSLGYGCDEEVMRLIKAGPKWTPSTEDNIAIESGVRVKMKFDPEKVRK